MSTSRQWTLPVCLAIHASDTPTKRTWRLGSCGCQRKYGWNGGSDLLPSPVADAWAVEALGTRAVEATAAGTDIPVGCKVATGSDEDDFKLWRRHSSCTTPRMISRKPPSDNSDSCEVLSVVVLAGAWHPRVELERGAYGCDWRARARLGFSSLA